MVLELEVRRFLDLEALDHGIELFSFRTWARVQCKTPGGWSPVLRALIDTGAPFSVLPRSLWSGIDVEGGFATHLRGLIPHPEAVLQARLANIMCLLSDLKNRTMSLSIWALLTEGEVPLVLGCAGVLDRTQLFLDGPHQRAHLEF